MYIFAIHVHLWVYSYKVWGNIQVNKINIIKNNIILLSIFIILGITILERYELSHA